jgi:hypothetical protein
MHPPNASIVEGLLERQMNAARLSAAGTFAIGRKRSMLWAFEAPGKPVA